MCLRGTSLQAILNYVDVLYGVERRTEFVLFLPSEERMLLERGVLASAWYPAESLSTILEAGTSHFGDPRFAIQVGRHTADLFVRGLYRTTLRRGRPLSSLQAASQTWSQHCDSGSLEVDAGVDEVLLTLHGWEATRALCARFGGYAVRLVALAGGKDVALEAHTCRLDGEADCRFLLRWS
jgi:hypothetical protein